MPVFKSSDRHSIAFPACGSSTAMPHHSTLRMYLLWSLSALLRDIQVCQVVKSVIGGLNDPGVQTL
jgi:hypothetical protein